MHMKAARMLLLVHAVLSTLIDIAGIDRQVLVAKLYRKALALRGRRAILSPRARSLDAERARMYVGKYVNAIDGVCMEIYVPLEADEDCLDARGYNAIYGEGAAESVVAKARTSSVKKRRRAQVRCCGCCTNFGAYVANNRVFCTYQVFRILGSIVATKVAYFSCGPPGALAVVCCCMVCGGAVDGACSNCYYKGLRFRNIVEDRVSAACTSGAETTACNYVRTLRHCVLWEQ